jgi:hypothetical protein
MNLVFQLNADLDSVSEDDIKKQGGKKATLSCFVGLRPCVYAEAMAQGYVAQKESPPSQRLWWAESGELDNIRTYVVGLRPTKPTKIKSPPSLKLWRAKSGRQDYFQ